MLLALALATTLNTIQVTPAPGAEAREEMSRLASLAGSWVATIEIMQPDGGWETAGEEMVEIRYMLGGLALREDPAEHPVNPFRLESTIQYDQNRDLYRLAVMDDTWGNMDIYEGEWNEDGALVLTNLRSGTSFENPDGTSLSFRLTTRIDGPNSNVFQIDMTADNGETWRPYQRISRTRYGIDN
ncbi:DUF1579 family protein [Maricaulis sp. MIT060901]|uniref:DUF1579 family protein n=1 Tax=Maricaulis sp. MIT060901 TaxID=3096993 RepID=UPI00399ADA69